MSINFYKAIRPLLFMMEPETAHKVTFETLKALATVIPPQVFFAKPAATKPVSVMGLNFPNQVGISAGIDKNGDYCKIIAAMNVGFIEVGGVTPKPQIGNPKPRVFRLLQQQAMINCLGFNNKGVDYLIANLSAYRPNVPLGVNITKNQTTHIANAASDYCYLMEKLYGFVDYFTINISCPNAPGLMELQFTENLHSFLQQLEAKRQQLFAKNKRYVRLVVKISPDLTADELRKIADVIVANNIDAITACNTSTSRPGLEGVTLADKKGGLSGRPIFDLTTKAVAILRQHLGPDFPIIAAGGIASPADAITKIEAGANLVQLYTGLVYHGPQLVADIITALSQ